MAPKTQPLKFTYTLQAPLAQVYRAFTNSTALREWLCDAAQADPRKGGRVHFWWNAGYYATGEYTALTPGKKVAFTWYGQGEPDVTDVNVSLAARNGGTRLTLTHAGVGSGKAWATAIRAFSREWQSRLTNLQSVLETGHDLRFTLRPMLGINVGEFNAEVAAKLGAPVAEGVLLEGVQDGKGAHVAGLQAGDVLVSLAGKKLVNWATLTGALRAHHAGDEVKVVFYRGPDKHAAVAKLSPRPLPEVPETAEALAAKLRKSYSETDEELAACFEGVSEAEAAYQPAPGEWSAKDVLAHLIIGERDTHTWIGDLIVSQERWAESWPDDEFTRHAGLLAVFTTVPELIAEFKRHEAETVAMLAALPGEFVARKSSYWRMAASILQLRDHTCAHFDQIHAAIAAARRR